MIVTVNPVEGRHFPWSRKEGYRQALECQSRTYGAMDVLCTDKTGTLTEGKIILENTWDVLGNPSKRVAGLWLHEQLLPNRSKKPDG